MKVTPADATTPDSYWTALGWFAVSRLLVSLSLWLASQTSNYRSFAEALNVPMFQRVALLYVLVAVVLLALIRPLKPHLQLQLFIQVGVDLLLLVALVHFGGGVRAGLGALMIASVAAGSVLASRRLAAFFAVVAAGRIRIG